MKLIRCNGCGKEVPNSKAQPTLQVFIGTDVQGGIDGLDACSRECMPIILRKLADELEKNDRRPPRRKSPYGPMILTPLGSVPNLTKASGSIHTGDNFAGSKSKRAP